MVKHTYRKKVAWLLVAMSLLSILVGSFAFFTDRVEKETSAVAGNLDISFVDISASASGTNGITSNNSFALDQAWTNSIISENGVINPDDYFDLSYTLKSLGNKSMDVRQQLVVTSNVAMTADAEEYTLTITGGNDTTEAVTGTLSDDKLSITYDLTDIILDGVGLGAETEDDSVGSEATYIVQLDFADTAKNAFMDSTVTVNLKLMAKQHRNTANTEWATWENYTSVYEKVDGVKEQQELVLNYNEDASVSAEINEGIIIKVDPDDDDAYGSDISTITVSVDGTDLDASQYTYVDNILTITDDSLYGSAVYVKDSTEMLAGYIYLGTGENNDPTDFYRILFSYNPENSTSTTYTSAGYAKRGEKLDFGAAVYLNNELLPLTDENVDWKISGKNGLSSGTTINNAGLLVIGADETDLNVITIEATYTTEDGEDISREHYVMVSDEDIELSVAVDSAEPYYANETYKVTATATSGSDPVDMLWAFDINNIDDEALCYSEIDENGNFFVDTAGTYKITAWADYMMGLKAEVTIDVQPEQIGEVDTFEVTVTDDSTGESWTTVNGELELTPNYQPSYTLSIAENKYKASWFNWELSEDMFGMSSVDVTNTGAYFNFYVDEHDGAYAVVTVTHKEDSSKTATIKVTLDEEDQYSDPQPDGV